MTSVMLVAHHERPEASELARAAATWLAARGHEAWMTPEDADALGLPDLAVDREPGSADLAVSLGGDGTMLRTVALLDGAPTPIIGLNLGQLGYLTEVEPGALLEALTRFDAGDFELDERMLLDVDAMRPGQPVLHSRALNEAVIERRESGHTVRVAVSIDGAPFTTYAADGLIVATPTGSTAYALSARGPIVSPQHRALLLTPVSPHMLFDRSLVLDPDETIEFEVLGHRAADLNVDGQHVTVLEPSSTVTCRAADCVARFVRFRPLRFHQILKTKFGLADR